MNANQQLMKALENKGSKHGKSQKSYKRRCSKPLHKLDELLGKKGSETNNRNELGQTELPSVSDDEESESGANL